MVGWVIVAFAASAGLARREAAGVKASVGANWLGTGPVFVCNDSRQIIPHPPSCGQHSQDQVSAVCGTVTLFILGKLCLEETAVHVLQNNRQA